METDDGTKTGDGTETSDGAVRDGELRAMKLRTCYEFTVSVLIVSFNTRDLLRECLDSLVDECARLPEGMSAEIIVVDNASRDGSAEMVEKEFAAAPTPVRVMRSSMNLGFGAANNLAIEAAEGRFLVLLNSDAFFHPGALTRAIAHINDDPTAGAGGARLECKDGSWQPSGRVFPSILGDALVLAGCTGRLGRWRIFGWPDRSWADPNEAAEVDWVTGAFMILRREALLQVGLFDPAFFLYSEEVDLCRRLKASGFGVHYWPDIVVTHLGGQSSLQVTEQHFSKVNAQVELWRIRSTLLYYRKHHGGKAKMALWLELAFYWLRRQRNRLSFKPWRKARAAEAELVRELLRKAWVETDGGRVSPPRPW
jgi:hypothetical protein